jgi:hypothetical protein
MTNLGKLSYFLGMKFVKTSKGMVMHKQRYALEILDKFEMNECNSILNPCVTSSNLKLEECIDEEKVNSTIYNILIPWLGDHQEAILQLQICVQFLPSTFYIFFEFF